MGRGRPKSANTMGGVIPCVRLAKAVFKEVRFHCQVFGLSVANYQREALERQNIFYRSRPLTAEQVALHSALDSAVKEEERLKRIKLKQGEIDANLKSESQVSREEPHQGEVSEEGEEIV